jgi:hypothetical protein
MASPPYGGLPLLESGDSVGVTSNASLIPEPMRTPALRGFASGFSGQLLLAALAFSGMGRWAAHAQALIDPAIQSVSSQLSYCCDRKAVYLVNGSGLTAGASGILGNSDSTHGNAPDGNMWVSDTGDTNPVLVFNLGAAYNLQATRVWNYNESCCTAFGARNVEISASLDNVDWTILTTNIFAQGGGGSAEPSQDFSTPAANVRYVRLRLLNNYGGALFGLSEVRFVIQPLTPYGGLTLFTNATTVELANPVQKLSFTKGADGKFHLTTLVWDGSTWRYLFDGQHPLIEGAAFNLEPTSYLVLTNSAARKSVKFQGSRAFPTYAFDITVDMDSSSDLAKFSIVSHLTSGLTLGGQQPTIGLWMNRASAQYVMHQGPPSATRGAFPPDSNCGFPAAYLWDQQQEAAIFFDLTPSTWMAANGVDRFLDVQARSWGNGSQTALGLYRNHVTGNSVPAGDMSVVFYLYSGWRPQGLNKLSDMLDKMLEAFQPLHPWTSVFPTNTLDGGDVSWSAFSQRTLTDLMVQNVTYGDRTNEPYLDSPLPLVSLPTEMIVHPSFATTNPSEALNAWNFATINNPLLPAVLWTRLHNSPQIKNFVNLKKDALPRFYNSNSRIIASGTQQPPFVFGLELSWQTLVYYQELFSLLDALAKEDFNPAIGGRLLMGLEGLIQYAQQVGYLFSVYYDPFSKQPVVFQENPGLGAIREPWSVGSYSYILLRAYELTGESKYLTEAQTAMNTLMTTMSYTESNSYYTATYSDPMQMPVMELMGNAYGAVAAAKLSRLTNESKYLTYQRDFLNVLLRMTTWFEDQVDVRSRDVRSLGLFYPFVAAPTPTAWETAEANLCLAWLLKNDRTNSRAPLLARLSNFNRINSFYFYPATFTPNIRSINPSLRTDVGQYFPTENMYTLEFPSGSGGSPSQTAIYMTGLGAWNNWLYEALAAATNRSILVLNLASLEDYEQTLRSAAREFLVCNPTDGTVITAITNQALEVGTYQVTVTDPSGAILSATHQTQAQLLTGFPITLNSQQVVYVKIENTNSAAILADIESYRTAGRELSHAYQLLQVEARDRGIGTNVVQLQALFGSAYQAYQSSNYALAYAQADQIVTNLLNPPALSLSITQAPSRLLVPTIASFSSFFGSRSPTNLVNGAGLTVGPSGILGAADSTHGTDFDGTMWYSNPYMTPPDTSPVVTFNLGSVYELQTTRLWQYNQPSGFTVYGAKDIAISVSLDDTNFTALSTIAPARAGGTNGEPAQDFATPAKAIQFIRFRILDTFGGAQASGLSEVRFVSGTAGVDLTVNGTQGMHYRVEYRNSLNPGDSWQLLQDIPALNSTNLLVHDLALIQTQRFYRAVQVQ